MKLAFLGSAALALGISAVIPSTAKADFRDRRDDNRYERVERIEVRHDDYRRDRDDFRRDDRYRDFDRDISIREVPRNVLETVDCERHGRRIEAIQFVHRDGKFFYRFRIDDPSRRDRDMNIRVQDSGRLLSIEEAGRLDPNCR